MAPALVPAFVLGATAWGLYGVALTPELAVVRRALAPLVELVDRLEPASWRPSLAAIVAAAVIALLVGLVTAWRTRLAEALHASCTALLGAAPSRVLLTGAAIVVVGPATAVAVFGRDPWQWFVWGLGLAASAAAAPRLAHAGPRGELVGALVGGITFSAAAVAAGFVPVELRPVVEQPALLAAPLGWAAARLARGPGSRAPG